MPLADFTNSGRQDTESFITLVSFCTLQAQIYIARYMDAQIDKKELRATKKEEWKIGPSPRPGNINPDADFAICIIYGGYSPCQPKWLKKN